MSCKWTWGGPENRDFCQLFHRAVRIYNTNGTHIDRTPLNPRQECIFICGYCTYRELWVFARVNQIWWIVKNFLRELNCQNSVCFFFFIKLINSNCLLFILTSSLDLAFNNFFWLWDKTMKFQNLEWVCFFLWIKLHLFIYLFIFFQACCSVDDSLAEYFSEFLHNNTTLRKLNF